VELRVARPGGRIEVETRIRAAEIEIRGCAGATVRAVPRAPAALRAEYFQHAPLALERARYAPERAPAPETGDGSLDALDAELAAFFRVETAALGRVRLRSHGRPNVDVVLAISREEGEEPPSAHPLFHPRPAVPPPAAPPPGEPPAPVEGDADAEEARPAGQDWRDFVPPPEGEGGGCMEGRPMWLVRIVRSDPVRYDALLADWVGEPRSASLRVGDLDDDGWPEVRLDADWLDVMASSMLTEGLDDRDGGVTIVDLATWIPELDELLSSHTGNAYAYEALQSHVSMSDANGDGRRDAVIRGRSESFDADYADEDEEPRPTRTAIERTLVYDAETDVYVPWTPPAAAPAE
jgi:hypothetical protein